MRKNLARKKLIKCIKFCKRENLEELKDFEALLEVYSPSPEQLEKINSFVKENNLF